MRQRHFPPERNLIPAHLTLFHHLPGAAFADIVETVRTAGRDIGPMTLSINRLQRLGRGVAYGIDCPALAALHKVLADGWRDWLTPQDRQPFRPHIVIQNKVEPDQASALYGTLLAEFVPFTATARGLGLWHYRGGPWQRGAEIAFGAP